MRHQAHRGCNVQVKVVELTWRAPDLGNELASLVEEAQYPALNVDLEPVLIPLPNADDASGESRNVVDPFEVMLFHL